MTENANITCGLYMKWTTELPYENAPRKSSHFCIRQDSDWFLELSLSREKYYLHLRNESSKKLEKPIGVTTFLRETRYKPHGHTDLFLGFVIPCYGPSTELWTANQSTISEEINNIFSVGKFSFVCLFDDSAKFISETTHISTQTDFDSSTFSRDLPSLSHDFGCFVEDKTFADVKLKCGDCTFSAHKSVLAARSEVFAAMFRNKMVESETGVVEVLDLDPDVLKPLLQYMYSGERPDIVCEGTTARRLYEAADRYGVFALKKACSEWMVSDMTQQNCLDLLVLANEYSDGELKDAASSFVASHLHLLSREAWSTFKKEHLELAVAVFEKRSADALSSQS